MSKLKIAKYIYESDYHHIYNAIKLLVEAYCIKDILRLSVT